MTVLSGGDVDVSAGTGFSKGTPLPLVRLTVTNTLGESVTIWMRPIEARAVGLDMIGGAHAAISDAAIRVMAKDHGLDGDSLIEIARRMTTDALGEG
jgi:hypothetical protein